MQPQLYMQPGNGIARQPVRYPAPSSKLMAAGRPQQHSAQIMGGQKEKIGPRKWRIRVSLGFDPVTRRYKRSPSRIVEGNSKDADAALAEYRHELQLKQEIPLLDICLHEYLDIFYANREILEESPLSRKSERMELKHIKEIFPDMPVKEITSAHIKRAYLEASNNGMTAPTLKRVSKRLKMVLEEATDDGILPRNPAAKVKVPEPKRKTPVSLTPDEAQRMCSLVTKEPLSSLDVAILLMLCGGMRKGEVLGLSWRDVDFERNEIFVRQQYSNDRTLRPPKSANSRRVISFGLRVFDLIAKWKDQQTGTIDPGWGFIQDEDTPVVTNGMGCRFDPTNFNNMFCDFCAEHGFGSYTQVSHYLDKNGKKRTRKAGYSGLTPHGLRHTHATLLIGAGTDLKSVSTRMGHSSITLTLDVYADAIRLNDVKAANEFDKLLAGVDSCESTDGDIAAS